MQGACGVRAQIVDVESCCVCMQVKRIGKFKSAGDQLLRKDMSEPQREQLSALLDGLYDYFLSHVAKACSCSQECVIRLHALGH